MRLFQLSFYHASCGGYLNFWTTPVNDNVIIDLLPSRCKGTDNPRRSNDAFLFRNRLVVNTISSASFWRTIYSFTKWETTDNMLMASLVREKYTLHNIDRCKGQSLYSLPWVEVPVEASHNWCWLLSSILYPIIAIVFLRCVALGHAVLVTVMRTSLFFDLHLRWALYIWRAPYLWRAVCRYGVARRRWSVLWDAACCGWSSLVGALLRGVWRSIRQVGNPCYFLVCTREEVHPRDPWRWHR